MLDSHDLMQKFNDAQMIYQPMTIARKSENISKNRWPNYPPYDSTRVILQTEADGGYINANYVNMKIGQGHTQKWIATQAPLEATISDFWNMVLQMESELIVMVTRLNGHDGAQQSFKYWPDPACSMQVNSELIVYAVNEMTLNNGMIDRIFSIRTKDTCRTVRHIQFVDWPDLGVPESSSNFTYFVDVMRRYQSNSSDLAPTIIHCSAGVGRTGTTIAVATALSRRDNRVPVNPFTILSQLRKQRGGLIQRQLSNFYFSVR